MAVPCRCRTERPPGSTAAARDTCAICMVDAAPVAPAYQDQPAPALCMHYQDTSVRARGASVVHAHTHTRSHTRTHSQCPKPEEAPACPVWVDEGWEAPLVRLRRRKKNERERKSGGGGVGEQPDLMDWTGLTGDSLSLVWSLCTKRWILVCVLFLRSHPGLHNDRILACYRLLLP